MIVFFSILCILGWMLCRQNYRFFRFFGQMSFHHVTNWSFVFQISFLSTNFFSVICPFGHIYLVGMFVRPFVFQPSVLPPATAWFIAVLSPRFGLLQPNPQNSSRFFVCSKSDVWSGFRERWECQIPQPLPIRPLPHQAPARSQINSFQ